MSKFTIAAKAILSTIPGTGVLAPGLAGPVTAGASALTGAVAGGLAAGATSLATKALTPKVPKVPEFARDQEAEEKQIKKRTKAAAQQAAQRTGRESTIVTGSEGIKLGQSNFGLGTVQTKSLLGD